MSQLRSDHPAFQRVEVDGQALLLPSSKLVDELIVLGQLDGRPLGTGSLFQQYSELARAVDGLFVALGSVLEDGKPWWIYHVVKQPFGYQRVHMESQRCRCGFKGLAGNPREYAIYIGTRDPLGAMLANEGTPKAGCPNCGARFDRPCVFVSPTLSLSQE